MMKLFSIDDLYWSFKFGKSKHKATIYDIRKNNFSSLKPPIFFLSTGRTGTKWFTELLSNKKDLMVLHSERPDFGIQNKYIYDLYNKGIDKELLYSIIDEIFVVGREQYIRYSYKVNKQIIETNNHVTFMAYALSEMFPNSKFVHLYRHPGEFVRSGLRRNWYAEDNALNQKLISLNDHLQWNDFSRIEKISWLWNETNAFINKFGETLSSDRFHAFNFNNLNQENVKELLNFMDIEISDNLLKKQLSIKSNVQKTGDYLKYEEWDKLDKEKLINICAEIAEKLGYKL